MARNPATGILLFVSYLDELRALVDKSVTVSGGRLSESFEIAIVDWPDLLAEEATSVAEYEALDDDDARQSYVSYNRCAADEIRNYHLTTLAEEFVDQGKWAPIGVLGMGGKYLESFAEVAADGALVVELSKNKSDPPVWLVKSDYLQKQMDFQMGNTRPVGFLDRLFKPNAKKVAGRFSELDFTVDE